MKGFFWLEDVDSGIFGLDSIHIFSFGMGI
jgi:hypothetical protein